MSNTPTDEPSRVSGEGTFTPPEPDDEVCLDDDDEDDLDDSEGSR